MCGVIVNGLDSMNVEGKAFKHGLHSTSVPVKRMIGAASRLGITA
jgi:hypothetical protein